MPVSRFMLPDFNFYPRPPRGGRRLTSMRRGCGQAFLSTPSARRATVNVTGFLTVLTISIHALREEGDQPVPTAGPSEPNFYPRPPRGGRPCKLSTALNSRTFLSTPSARRATFDSANALTVRKISIHALREEGDLFRLGLLHNGRNFYPRPPRGGRPGNTSALGSILHFYPRPPRGGRPASSGMQSFSHTISIHALREEGDDADRCGLRTLTDFYPRPPRGGRLGIGRVHA